LEAVEITINNLIINNSMAFNGGALYINLINNASFIIFDSNFNNSFAFTENSIAKGGAIYVSVIKTTNLKLLKISNCNFINVISKDHGGVIYLDYLVGKNNNKIILQNLNLSSCYSYQGALIYARS
jgi:hypothetical protein